MNPDKCQGHGRCFALAPDLFDLDDFGISSVIGDGTVPPDRERVVRLVAANCPEFAVEVAGDAADTGVAGVADVADVAGR